MLGINTNDLILYVDIHTFTNWSGFLTFRFLSSVLLKWSSKEGWEKHEWWRRTFLLVWQNPVSLPWTAFPETWARRIQLVLLFMAFVWFLTPNPRGSRKEGRAAASFQQQTCPSSHLHGQTCLSWCISCSGRWNRVYRLASRFLNDQSNATSAVQLAANKDMQFHTKSILGYEDSMLV